MKAGVFLFISLLSFTKIIAQDSVFDVARYGTVQQMENLYRENPDVINKIDSKKFSPLILACYRGNEDVALFLIEKVKDIDYTSGMGTALMAAVMNGNLKLIEKLIDHKANLNITDKDGKTALIYAVFFNKNEIAKALINAGADKMIKDNDGKKAIDFAEFNSNTELIILLTK